MRQLIAAACAALLAAGGAAAHAAPVTVRIDSGAVVGDREGAVESFKGVPFAKPVVGELRWAPPQAPP